MSPRLLVRLSGLACMAGGLCLAAFVLIHPWDQFLGAAVAQTTQWQSAHKLHFIGAALVLPGLVGIYAQQLNRLGLLGLIGFALSFIGNAMFLGTGMITAFIWPMLAVFAPICVEPGGPLFTAPISLAAFALTAIATVAGYVLFGIAMLRAHVFPRTAVLLLSGGAVLGMLPPHPLGVLPWAGLVLGGVLYGAALVWIGAILWRENAPDEQPSMAGAQ